LNRLLILLLLALLCGCNRGPKPRVLILGIDGCDPNLLQQYMDEGKLPHFTRLKEMGGFRELGTVMPPQSPVAWATFTTGLDPGGHGIFDFIHRDPDSLRPVPSLTKVEDGHAELLRKGTPFWEYLVQAGIPAMLMKVPANFPPDGLPGQVLSGMGTPDLEGSYGTFTFYTTDKAPPPDDLTGGRWVKVAERDGLIRASLVGPNQESLPLEVIVEDESALLRASTERLLLNTGEWSDWVPLEFESAPGMVRFYLKSAKPLKLYASPVNLDPCAPVQAITSPESFSRHLCRCCGRFYTQGMPEDTKALMHSVLSDAEFLQQNDLVIQERRRLFKQGLAEFDEGLFFFYFSAPDILSHLYWNTIDPSHPGYSAERAEGYSQAIESAYLEADSLVGEALEEVDSRTTLLVVSDHGFAPFRRAFNLNSWLKKEGYLGQTGSTMAEIDWARTRAYGVGFNGLYLNMEGREKYGVVTQSQRKALLNELKAQLLTIEDPQSGQRVVREVYLAEDIYSPQYRQNGPDLIIGYESGYRASWQTVLGSSEGEILEDNLSAWSGDHLMAADVVPGILLSSQSIGEGPCSLLDIAPTTLAVFGVAKPESMPGRNLLAKRDK
jgi:predicted AlkP superfamily phosphohydrolase/phosphomutase